MRHRTDEVPKGVAVLLAFPRHLALEARLLLASGDCTSWPDNQGT